MQYRFLRFPDGKAKAVTLSYDDGCPEDIRFSNIITKFGLKCTFNHISDEAKKGTAFTNDEVVEHFLSKGHEIAIHGYFHKAVGLIRPVEVIRDILDCRLELEKKYNRIIKGLAYANTGIKILNYDNSYEKIREMLINLDIAYARNAISGEGNIELPDDFYNWLPTAHHDNPKLFDYIEKFLSLDTGNNVYYMSRRPRIFFMWGHTYEFERNNNWELLDKICEKLSFNKDIWYATNIEICNYIKSYNSLEFSADETIVYNPTVHKIWFNMDGNDYIIHSGETIRI